MSLLDTFTILFDADSKDATKGVNDLDKSMERAEKSANDLIKSVTKLAAAYFGLSAIKAGVLNNALDIDNVGKFSQTLGFNLQQVDAWGAAIERNGGSAEGFRGTLSGIKTQLDDLEMGKGQGFAESLARIGVNATNSNGKLKDSFEILQDISTAFEGMSAGQSSKFGRILGLDQGTILLLQQSRYQVDQLVRQQMNLADTTNENYEAAANFNDAMDNSKRSMNSLFTTANGLILPILTDLLKGFNSISDWGKNHKDLLVGFFVVVAGAMMTKLLPAIAAIDLALSANPLFRLALIVGGIATAFALLYEDIVAYNKGQSSFIGDMIKQYPILKDIIDGVRMVIKGLYDTIKQNIDWTKLLFTEPQAAIDRLKQGFVDFYEYIKGLFTFDFISNAIDDAKSLFGMGKSKPSGDEGNFPDLPMFDSNNQMMQNTQKALSMQSAYSANPFNSNANYMTAMNSQRNVSYTFGPTSIDARGMDRSEAQGLMSDTFAQQIASAKGRFDDGEIS